MRRNGVVESARGLVPFGHLGWAYHDAEEFWARATEYLADGIAEGQWVEYVGDASSLQLRTQLVERSGIAEFADPDHVAVTPVNEFYAFESGSDLVHAGRSVVKRVDATQAAVEAGYAGFRAVVDCGAVVRTAEQREAFARFEYLIDHVMAVQPVSALCAYDVRRLGDAAAELVCLHPFVNPQSTRFRLYAEPHAPFLGTGELLVSGDEDLTATLRRTGPLSAGENLRVDDHEMRLSVVRESRPTQPHSLTGLGRRHEHGVLPPAAESVTVRTLAASELTRVRRFARERARWLGMVSQDRSEDLALIVSELATNGLTHGEPPCEVTLWREGDDVCCTVTDHGHLNNPLDGYRRAQRPGGWALPLIHRLADHLGIHTSPGGTTVHVRMTAAG